MRFLFTAIAILFFMSCTKSKYKNTHTFSVETSNGISELIYVKKNNNSDVYIIYFPNSFENIENPVAQEDYKKLEELYNVVYWVIKNEGMDNFVEMTNLISLAINEKYSSKNVFFMTTERGTLVANEFLQDAANQNLIKGWVNISGSSDYKKALELSSIHVLEFIKNIL